MMKRDEWSTEEARRMEDEASQRAKALLSRFCRTTTSQVVGILRRVSFPTYALFALIASAGYAGRTVVAKLKPEDISLTHLLLLQSLLALPILWGFARGHNIRLRASRPGLLRVYGWRAFWGVATTYLLFYAIMKMPVALASTFSYTSPLFIVLLAPILLGERNNVVLGGLTVVGFAGVAVNAAPYFGQVSAWLVGLGLLTGMSGALMQIYIRKLALAGEPGLAGVFWMHVGATVGSAVWCVVTGDFHISTVEVYFCAVVAFLSTVAQLANAAAYKNGKALPVNALTLSTLPLTFLMAWILLAEDITVVSIVGMCITLPACFGLVWFEQYRLKKMHKEEGVVTSAQLEEEAEQILHSYAPGADSFYVQHAEEKRPVQSRVSGWAEHRMATKNNAAVKPVEQRVDVATGY